MNDVKAELEAMAARESWTAEDCRQVRELLLRVSEPVRTLRELAASLAGENPDPAGSAAVKLGIIRYMLLEFGTAAELLAKGTDNKERRFYQGLCHKQLQQWDQALEAFQWAEERGWDTREATLQVAEVQCLAGDVAAAARSLGRFAKSSQADPDWYRITGMVQEMQGEYDQAVESYETARQLEPGHAGATFRLAYHYDLHGDEEAAIELYRECVTAAGPAEEDAPAMPRHPIYVSALLNLAVLYEDAGRYDDATRCLKRILIANPNHARARLFLRDVAASRTMVFDEDEAKRTALRNDLLAIPVTDFELSVRARNCLKKMNIPTLGDLLHVTEAELLTYKNFGETSLMEIKQMLSTKNLRLGQMLEEGATKSMVSSTPSANVGNEGVLATLLSQVAFSVRARRALETLEASTLGELASKTEAELLACRNFGQTSLNEIQQRLGEYGLRLREP